MAVIGAAASMTTGQLRAGIRALVLTRPVRQPGSARSTPTPAQDLASRLAAGPGAHWCVTLTDPDGRAAAHAGARARPDEGLPGAFAAPGRVLPAARAGPAKPPVARADPGKAPGAWSTWLALRFQWLEHGQCGHRREGQAYGPSRALRHLITIRQRTCGHPGCRRPAEDCDLDHTIPYQQGSQHLRMRWRFAEGAITTHIICLAPRRSRHVRGRGKRWQVPR